MKILLIEDDQPAAAILAEILAAHYYTVDVATDGQLGLELALSSDYGLVLLDLLIPKLDGIHLCQQLRTQGFQKPILLLTAKDASEDVVQGLDAGADDYVIKPYDLSQLLARMRALLRRGATNLAPMLLTWGELSVNPVAAEVTYAGHKLSLSPKEYSLLGLFLRNPQRVFSRSDIIDRLWSIDAAPSEGTVTNLIKDLRQKLKAAGMVSDWLETVYGLGYRLKAPPKPVTTAQTSHPKQENPRSSVSIQAPNLAGIKKVIQQYQATFAARVAELEQVIVALQRGSFSQTSQQQAIQEAHKLAGTLGSFGYEQGSRLARSIEHLLSSDAVLIQAHASQLATLVADLKQTLHEPPTPLTLPIPQETQRPLVWILDDNAAFTTQLPKPIAPVQIFAAIRQGVSKTQAPTAKVLILDDDPGILEILRCLLQPWGLMVTTLHNPVQFWEILTTTQPDLLVLDLEMPELSGIDLCRVVRQDAAWGDLPILVITAHTDRASIQQVFAAGADDFIAKPVVGPELVTRVISHLDRARLQQELETLKRRIGA